jgi:hypothetical protein
MPQGRFSLFNEEGLENDFKDFVDLEFLDSTRVSVKELSFVLLALEEMFSSPDLFISFAMLISETQLVSLLNSVFNLVEVSKKLMSVFSWFQYGLSSLLSIVHFELLKSMRKLQ